VHEERIEAQGISSRDRANRTEGDRKQSQQNRKENPLAYSEKHRMYQRAHISWQCMASIDGRAIRSTTNFRATSPLRFHDRHHTSAHAWPARACRCPLQGMMRHLDRFEDKTDPKVLAEAEKISY
jgi:hypothetical protein